MNTARVLLPVYNAQESLEAGVAEILEILAELAVAFELVILDDGSTDDTADVARGLAARYPQVRVLRHPVRLGLAEAIQTGLDHALGEAILLGDEQFDLDPDDLSTLWQLRETQGAMNRWEALPAVERPAWLDRLLAWRPAGPRRRFQIIWRRAFEQFRERQLGEMIRRRDAARPPLAPIIARRQKDPDRLKLAGMFTGE